MSTVREKIINALTLFYASIKSKFVLVGNVVNNCASTSTTYPLAANQGTQLQNQIDELNTNFIFLKYNDYIATITSLAPNETANAQVSISVPDGAGIASVSIISNGYNGGIIQSVTHITNSYIVITAHNFESSTKSNLQIKVRIFFVRTN